MRNQSTNEIDSARGWLVVFAGFVGAFVTFGATYCFGVFLKPIALEFHASHASMSALFALITVLSFFLAPFTGKIADCHGARPVVAVGALLFGAGFVLAAHVHSFLLLFLTYGIGLGGALAFTYVPAISAVGEWFKVRRDLALGVAISGIGCGTFVAAPLSARLIERYGWRTVFDIFGLTGMALLLLCAALLIRPPRRRRKEENGRCRQGSNSRVRHPVHLPVFCGNRGLRIAGFPSDLCGFYGR